MTVEVFAESEDVTLVPPIALALHSECDLPETRRTSDCRGTWHRPTHHRGRGLRSGLRSGRTGRHGPDTAPAPVIAPAEGIALAARLHNCNSSRANQYGDIRDGPDAERVQPGGYHVAGQSSDLVHSCAD